MRAEGWLTWTGNTIKLPVQVAPGQTVVFTNKFSWPETAYVLPWNLGNESWTGPSTIGGIKNDLNGKTFIKNYYDKVINGITKFDTNIFQVDSVAVTLGEEVSPKTYTGFNKVIPKASDVLHGDPLAQTFFVNASENPDGYFVSSIDLFFSKVSAISDVTVQLRPTVNGIPSSSDIIPFAISSLAANQVNVTDYPNSTDPKSFTKFKFDSPIYLLPGMYSIVIMSQSSDYEVFTATMGSHRINNNDAIISSFPYVGNLFKSSNGSTWAPSPASNICFCVNRCEFDSSGTANFISDKPYVNYSNTFNTFMSATYYHQGDHIRVESGNNIDRVYEAMNTGLSGGTAPDHLTGDVLNGSTASGVTFRYLSTGTRYADLNVPYDTYFTQGENITFTSTKAKYSYKGTHLDGTLDSSFNPTLLSTNYPLTQRKILDSNKSNLLAQVLLSTSDPKLSPVIDNSRYTNVLIENIINANTIAPDFISNTAVNSGDFIRVPYADKFRMYQVMTQGTTSLAPPIFEGNDSPNGSAMLRYMGMTHNGDTELLPYKGQALSRYITRKVELASGFESTDLVATFNAITPVGSSIKVYYKAAFINGGTTLESTPYYEMKLKARSPNFLTQFVEHSYVCDYGDGTIRYALPNMAEFNQFIVKIVLLSTDTTSVPQVSALRVMALYD